MSTSPGLAWSFSAIWFAIVAVGTKIAASWPSSVATRSCNALTDGSSRFCSSPTAASAIARRIPSVGFVAVSERRSITGGDATVSAHGHRPSGENPGREGEPAYRGRQVWEWTARGAASYDDMTTLPKALRATLGESVPFSTLELVTERESKDGTVKALFRTPTGIRSRPCSCATGTGVVRCASRRSPAARSRARSARRERCASDGTSPRRRSSTRRSTSAGRARGPRRYMGMGEPFLNLDEVLAPRRRLPDLGITHRRRRSRPSVDAGLATVRRRGRLADPARALAPRGRREAVRAMPSTTATRSTTSRGVPALRRAATPQGVRRVRHARRRQRLPADARRSRRCSIRGVQGQPTST